LPQGFVNYWVGYRSYYRGLGRGLKHVYWRTGLAGSCLQMREVRDEAIAAFALHEIATNPQVRAQVESLAEDWAKNNKAYLAGRLSAGVVTSTLAGAAGAGYAAGPSAVALAGMGDALEEIDQGSDEISDIARGFIMGEP
jgi:hypothetical protein